MRAGSAGGERLVGGTRRRTSACSLLHARQEALLRTQYRKSRVEALCSIRRREKRYDENYRDGALSLVIYSESCFRPQNSLPSGHRLIPVVVRVLSKGTRQRRNDSKTDVMIPLCTNFMMYQDISQDITKLFRSCGARLDHAIPKCDDLSPGRKRIENDEK